MKTLIPTLIIALIVLAVTSCSNSANGSFPTDLSVQNTLVKDSDTFNLYRGKNIKTGMIEPVMIDQFKNCYLPGDTVLVNPSGFVVGGGITNKVRIITFEKQFKLAQEDCE